MSGLAAAALSLTLATGASALDWENCIQAVQPSDAGGWPHVSEIEDRGNLTVMSLAGAYERGSTAPRQEVAQAFYATHPDRYDFLFVFTTFEFPTGGALAFYNGIANDTAGTGNPIYSHSAQFGSASGKLQGYIDMAALGRYSFAPDAPEYKALLDTAAHELMHRWVASVRYRKGDGTLSGDLLGQENAHWSYFLDTDASVMYGADWRDRGDGTFEAIDTRHRYGPLDLYLAGFAGAGEVAPFGLIRGGEGAAVDLPRQGAVTHGTLETVSVDQIVAAEGPRVPDAAHAPKEFRAALVLLRRPGETVSAETYVGIEQFRSRFQQRFAQMTDGRATLRVVTENRSTAQTGLPEILHGSGTTGTPPGRAAAVAWLEAAQQADGHWEDRPGTAVRDTVAAYAALTELHPEFPGLAAARAWLAAHAAVDVEQRSARLSSGQGGADLPVLLAARSEGGWGLLDAWPATPLDSAVAVRGLVAAGRTGDVPLEALQYLVGQQDADGGFGFVADGRARVLATLRVADALGAGGAAFADARQRAGNWLALRQHTDGSFGDGAAASVADTVEVFAAGERAALGSSALEGARIFVAAAQQLRGDWGGSVYTTALAALATARDGSANLAVAGRLSIAPAAPRDGDRVALGATIVNSGRSSVPATTAQWYLGDPRAGGTPIGAPLAVPALAGYGQTALTQRWDTTGLAGARTVWLALDTGSVVTETSEDDNFASVAVDVAPPDARADLMLDASEIRFDPAVIGALPATIRVSGTLHNLGLTAVPGATLRLLAVRGSGDTPLGEATIAVAGRSSAPFELSFTQTAPGAVHLAVVADPDGTVTEANEDNNRADATLGAQASIDPAVADADLTVGPATVGHDVPIRVVVRNFGTLDTPLTPLRIEVVQGATRVTLFDGGVQIPGGGSITRDLSWRPAAPGAATLSVDVDPANVVVEADESNNHASHDFEVRLTASTDLAIADDSLAFLPSPALEGSPMTASLRVRNLGNAASGPFSVALFARDPALGGAPLAKTVVTDLAAGAETTVAIPVASTPGSGDEHFYAVVDADAQVAEDDESNNTAVALLRVLPLPDVAVTVADIALSPSLPVPGEPVRATVQVHNLGGQPARDVDVRFYEGAAGTGTEIAPAQHLAVLEAGASAQVAWNWTLGADARQVTVVATSGGDAPDANPANDSAALPFDVQDGDFYTSERYISPDGDGVRDAAAVVFRIPSGTDEVSVDVRNGVPRVVRRFGAVSRRDDGRVQVLWDGRDDQQRIVPDGDYRLVVRDAAGREFGEVLVTVDLNRSSPLEAVHTRYEVMARLPSSVEGWQRVPREGGFGNVVIGIGKNGTMQNPAGLYRSDVLLPQLQPIVTPRWVAQFVAAHGSSQWPGVAGAGIAPDGATVVFVMRTDRHIGSVYRTRIDQTDAVQLLADDVPIGYDTMGVWFFDEEEALVGDYRYDITAVNLRTRATRPLPHPGDALVRVTPEGVLGGNWNKVVSHFVPRDGGAPVQIGDPDYYGTGYAVSPDGRHLAEHRTVDGRERVSLIRVTDGSRREVYGIDAYTIDYESQSQTIDRLQMAWLEIEGQLLIGDSSSGRILRYDLDGRALGESAILPIERRGDYVIDFNGNGGESFAPAGGDAQAGAEEPSSLVHIAQTFREAAGSGYSTCGDPSNWARASTQRNFYDPAGDRVYFGTQESIAYVSTYSGVRIYAQPGIVDYQSTTLGAPLRERLAAATLTPLVYPSDQRVYPLVECAQTLPAAWPRWMLADGARIRADQRIETLASGLKPGPWAFATSVVDVWPDETHLAIGNPDSHDTSFDRVFSSLLNEPAVLRLTPLGRGIQLFGNATDRNFSTYRIDWTDADAPGTWHVVTPPSHDQVFLEEFLTWVPPQPGNYLVRLTLTDLAGNVTTASATASSEDSSPIESLQVEPRYFSPNGDGVQDQAVGTFVVREPVSLAFEIRDENGAVVRHVSQTYGATELGAHEFRWDGRDDQGEVVPDGRYHFEVEGFGLWLTVDTKLPELSTEFIPVVVEQPPGALLPQIKTGIRYRAADRNLSSIQVDSASAGGADWRSGTPGEVPPEYLELPEDLDRKKPSELPFGLATYTGRQFRAVAIDRAGNAHAEFAGQATDQLIPFGFITEADAPLLDPYLGGPRDGNPGDGTSEVIVGQEGTDRILVADAVGGLDHLVVETAPRGAGDLSAPTSGWVTRLQRPAEYHCVSTACIAGADGRVFNLPLGLAGVPGQTLLWVRVRGVRADGYSITSFAIPIRVVGIDAPTNLDYPRSSFGCYAVAYEYVPGVMTDAHLNVTFQGNTRVFGNAQPKDGEIRFFIPNYSTSPESADAYVDAIGSDGRLYRSPPGSVAVSCGGSSGPGGEGENNPRAEIKAYVLGHETCDATPTNRIQLDLGITGGEQFRRARLSYQDPVGGDWRNLAEFTSAGAQSTVFDTSGVPEGTVTVRAEGDYGDGYVAMTETDVQVLHTAPVAQLDVPAPGTRVCPVRDGQGRLGIVTEGRASGKNGVGYKFEIELASAAGRSDCYWDVDILEKNESILNDKCSSLDKPYTPGKKNWFGPLMFISRLPTDPDEQVTLRLKAVNWSGATVCSANTVQVDAAVELVERRTPTPRLPAQPPGWLAFSSTGKSEFREAHLYLKAQETLTVSSHLAHAQQRQGVWIATDDALRTFQDQEEVHGDFDVVWDGRDGGGNMLADGVYALVVEAQDHCGTPKRLTYFVEVDATPPDLDIARPAAAELVQAPAVGVSGRVLDPHLEQWKLSIDAGQPPLRQDISDGAYPVADGGALGNFSRSGASGPATLHLVAVDALGNEARFDRPFVLGDPTVLIFSAAVQPDLFSPNGDGRLDATRIATTLLHASRVDLDVLNAGGVAVRALRHDEPLASGSAGTAWDGRGNGGTPLADGVYTVRLTARNADDLAYAETADLPVEIDTLAPAIVVDSPTEAVVGASAAVVANVSDRNLQHYRVALLGAGGQSIAAVEGAQGGTIYLTDLADAAEGDYTVRVEATDRAGNLAQKDQSFTLDRTPPEVALSAPIDGAVLRGGRATTVRGHVTDAHLARYTLAVAPADSETWTDVASGTEPVADGDLAAWTPNLPDGRYRLRLRGVDRAGNAGEAVVALEIDTTPPVARITAPADDGFVQRGVDVLGTASDAHFAAYGLAIATPAQAQANQWSELVRGDKAVVDAALAHLDLVQPDGDYVLRLTATDAVALSATAQARIHLDTAPPPAPLALVVQLENNRHSLLQWTAVSAPDLAGYVVYRDGSRLNAEPNVPASYRDQDVPEGRHVYFVRAIDRAGNESAPSNSVEVLIDHTPPTVSLLAPLAGARLGGRVDVVGTAYSRDDFKEYRLSVVPLAPPGPAQEIRRSPLAQQVQTLGTWDTRSLADETRVRVRLEGEDLRGNVAVADIEVTVDNGPPAPPTGLVVALAGVDVDAHWNPNAEADLLGYLLYRDGRLVNAADDAGSGDLRPFALVDTHYLDQRIADGQHSYVVRAIDQAGNVSGPSDPASLPLIDNGPPHLAFTQPQDGAQFETSIVALAISADRDITDVRFAYRRVGDSAWTALGEPFALPPYRVTFTPGALPLGDYEIRAVATDASGHVDPAPPVVRVKYADLTAPDAPRSLQARAQGREVHLHWSASAAADTAGYNLWRKTYNGYFYRINSALVAGTDYVDANPDGSDPVYYVTATDASNNESLPSNEALAHVFTVTLEQPYSPVTDAAFDLAGRSGRAGTLRLHVEAPGGSSDSDRGRTGADGTLSVPTLALAMGTTRVVATVTDDDGNVSVPGEVWMDRGAAPSTPTGLQVGVDDHRVTASWNANPEPDVIGYRVFRDGRAVAPDATGGFPLTATSDGCCDVGNLVDGDPATVWNNSWWSPQEPERDPAAVIAFDEVRYVAGVQLAWTRPASHVDLYAWSGHAWVRIASRDGDTPLDEELLVARAYRTDQLKLVLRNLQGTETYNDAGLAELRVLERALQPGTTLAEDVIDGRHSYRVSAVNALGFESAQSDPAGVDVGDAEAPAPVVLSGTMDGADAHLSWTASASPDAARYVVFRDGEWLAEILAADPLEYLDAGLANGSYVYTVRVYDRFDNESEASNEVTLNVTQTLPEAPRILAVTAPAEGGALELTWEAGSGTAPDHFVLRRATAQGGPYEVVDEVEELAYRDEPLLNGTRYYYTVESIDALGNASGQSAPADGVPRDRTAPEPPQLTFPTVPDVPLTMRLSSTSVCGYAEPGAAVTLALGGLEVGGATAALDTQLATYVFERSYYDRVPLPSPDGSSLFAADYQGASLLDSANGSELLALDRNDDVAAWNVNGSALYTAGSNGRAVIRRDLTTGQVVTVEHPFASIAALAVNADESALLVAGDYDAGDGNGLVSGLWLYDRAAATTRRLGTWDAYGIDMRALRFSPAGGKALVRIDSSQVSVIDLATRQVAVVADDALARPVWSPDGTSVAFSSESDGGLHVRLYDVRRGTSSDALEADAPIEAIAWRPDGQGFALLTWSDATGAAVEIHARRADGGYDLERTDPVAQDGGADLTWTPAGRLLLLDSHSGYTQQPAGWFCSDALPLLPGANLIDATAADASGNVSLSSLPIELDRPATSVADLAVSATDILFAPATGAPGGRFGAVVTLRNRGGAAAAATLVQFDLTAPDGGLTHPQPVTPLHALAPGEAQSLSLDFGTLAQAGAYRLRVAVDPQNAIDDADRSNNVASATLQLIAGDLPAITAGVSRGVYAPGEEMRGDVDVVNPGAPFSGRVDVAVIDAGGVLVKNLGSTPLDALGFGAAWHTSVRWIPDAFAGDYRLRAELRDRTGALVASAAAPFAIEASRTFDLRLQPDRSSASPNQAIALATDLVFLAGNAPMQGAQLRWTIRNGSGGVVWNAEQALGTLLPGYALHRTVTWPGAAAPGPYRAEVHLVGGALDQLAGADLLVQAPGETAALAGTLAFDPGTPFVAGRPMQIRYHAGNVGTLALAGAQLRLRVSSAPAQPALAQRTDTVDLAAGQGADGVLDLAASPLALGSYAAVLDAHVAGDAAGTWRPLAQAGFAVVDGLPPDIRVLQPDASVVQPAVVPLAAVILDSHSAVAGAEVSVDGGNFQPLALRADGTWGRGLVGLGDGAHRLAVRARDSWGNPAQTGELPFVVDATPPRIDIAGVADGELANHPVTPLVTISDDHLASSETVLGSQPFVSGSTLEQDGVYVLTARAVDAAGNGSARMVRFTIDRTAPPIAIGAPADGTVVVESSVEVTVQSEAAARVLLGSGSYHAELVADAAGIARFAAVPLVEGDNAISAQAVDAATNASPTVSVHVRYQAGQTAAVTGTLQPPGAEVAAGDTLRLGVRVTNPNAAPLPAQALRVSVLSATQQPLAQQEFSHVFAANEVYETSFDFATSGWALGTLSLKLELGDGGSFTLLDAKTVALVDRAPPQIAAVAPTAGAIVRSPVALQATASDALSGVTRVEANIDGGDWLELAAGAPPNYASAAQALADGDHTWSARADDGAGNQGHLDPIAFVVDSTPPRITIGGVADGDLLAHAVTPTIEIVDAHPRSSDIRLNGQPFVSGTSVTASGDYTLSVTAVDAADNTSEAGVHFTLDFDAPTVVFTAPADGAVLTQPSVEVSGSTEARATVHLTVGGFSVDVVAGDDGIFTVPDVPLQPGVNAIQAQATDRVGNVGPAASLSVTYQPAAPGAIVGTLGALASPVERGRPLAVPYTLGNVGDTALAAQPIRVELRPAASEDVLAEQSFDVDLAAHEEITDQTSLATSAVPLGRYRVLLLAWLPDQGGIWTTLDTAAIEVVRAGCTYDPDVLFANGFEAPADLIFCDGFDRRFDLRSRVGASSEALLSRVPYLARNAFAVMRSLAGFARVVGDRPRLAAWWRSIGSDGRVRVVLHERSDERRHGAFAQERVNGGAG
ncbi:CARDB domain-containing protein [Dokdonella sp.]|uniref:CARDB domain-containing protein n=1 Tax=Dokdonella sp. TaxID=2291710 RepID=UPI001B250026|nr:CARDB domain-containing protein [Dokdonella sp.]MBO9664190.1 hypothetical protein [Dokdonella sp.]